jgi:hypothetical protein
VILLSSLLKLSNILESYLLYFLRQYGLPQFDLLFGGAEAMTDYSDLVHREKNIEQLESAMKALVEKQ